MDKVAALFVQRQSIYKLPPLSRVVDSWDEQRDARRFQGGMPVIAHPPCRLWSRLAHCSTAPEEERELGLWAVRQVRRWGGVLEHPAWSKLWPAAGLPAPGGCDAYGFTVRVDQWHWGHKALKPTWLYIVGIGRDELPPMPFREGEPTHVVGASKSKKPEVQRWERSATPRAFAEWLYEIAKKCRGQHDH